MAKQEKQASNNEVSAPALILEDTASAKFPSDIFDYLFLALVFIALITRFYNLDAKAFHHDESLYARYSYNFSIGQGHRYDPLMHGPFLFILNGSLMYLIGSSDTIARSPAAFFGVLLVALCYFLRPFFGKKGVFLLALYFTLSPSITYFSRFLRMDIFVLVFTFATIVFFLRFLAFKRSIDLYISILSLSLFFCTKENSFLHTFEFVTFIILMWAYPIIRKQDDKTFGLLWSQIKQQFWQHKYKILIAFCLFWIVFILLYTTFFTNPRGFVDGLGRKAIPYWIHQNKIRRVRGEYHYHLTRMLMYELPLVIGFVVSAFSVFWKRKNHLFIALAITFFLAGLHVQWGHLPLPVYKIVGDHGNPTDAHIVSEVDKLGLIPKLLSTLHMQCYGHVFLFFYVVVMGFWLTFTLLEDKWYLPAFFIYYSMFSFLMYSYLGEKVAWLTIHIYLGMALTVAYFGAKVPGSYKTLFHFGVGVLALYMMYCNFGLNFYKNGVNEDNPFEIICYTQTHADIKKLLRKIEKISEASNMVDNLPLFVRGDSAWPLTWYWREHKQLFWAGENGVPDTTRPVVIMNWEDRNKFDYILKDDFELERYKLRAWTVLPNLDKSTITWGEYFRYLVQRLDRKPLFAPGVGSTDIAVFFRKDVQEGTYNAAYKGAERPRRATPTTEGTRTIFVPYLISWGSPGNGTSEFNEPRAIAISQKGDVYVADTNNNRIQKFDGNGRFIKTWGSQGNKQNQFEKPSGIAVDRDGYVYVSDTWNHRIQKFTADGDFVKMWGVPGAGNTEMELWAPKGLALDQNNNLYVVNTGCHKINKFNSNGEFIAMWGMKTLENSDVKGGFLEPVGIAIDPENHVYVCDTNNHRVQVFTAQGKYVKEISTLGWQDFYAEPFICLNSRSDVFVSDSVNNRIQVYDQDGNLIAIWGKEGKGSGEFYYPKGLAYSDGFIYVVDSLNNRIQKFTESTLGF